LQKYFCFSESQIKLYDSPSRPTEGRLAIVTDAGRDAVDAAVLAIDEQHQGGRRSRVVLTPRRWCQVGGGNSACDGVNKPITGESTKEAVKPLRGECRVIPV
jgi:hypothetical protein